MRFVRSGGSEYADVSGMVAATHQKKPAPASQATPSETAKRTTVATHASRNDIAPLGIGRSGRLMRSVSRSAIWLMPFEAAVRRIAATTPAVASCVHAPAAAYAYPATPVTGAKTVAGRANRTSVEARIAE